MADYTNKYLDSAGVKHLWQKGEETYVKKVPGKELSEENFSAEEKEKLAGLENYELPAASGNSLGGIKIGEGLQIDANGVVKTVYNPEMPVEWDDIQDIPTTIEGYGITDAVTQTNFETAISDMQSAVESAFDAVDAQIEEVREAVSKVYKYKGQVQTLADLNNIQNPKNGDVYDVVETGMNYAWNAEENRWDNLGEIFEIEALSNYEIDVITGSASSSVALKEILTEGGNASLATNLTLAEPVTIKNDTVLDLNGHTLAASNQSGYLLNVDGAKLTIKGGNISAAKRIANAENGGEIVIKDGVFSSSDVALSATGAGSKVTFDGGDLTALEGGIGSFDGASIEVNGGKITGTDNFPLFTNGTSGRGGNTIVFNDGELVGNITSNGYEACGVYIANNDTFVMNGGKITANGGCGILMRAGTVTINDGEVTATTGAHVPGWVGDNKTKMSASAVIYHETANYPGKAGMSLTINGGKFVGADHAVEVLSDEATPNVHINGGEFTPAL